MGMNCSLCCDALSSVRTKAIRITPLVRRCMLIGISAAFKFARNITIRDARVDYSRRQIDLVGVDWRFTLATSMIGTALKLYLMNNVKRG